MSDHGLASFRENKKTLLSLARAGKTKEFCNLFLKFETEEPDVIFEVSGEVGYAAIDARSISILEFINRRYEKPFEIFSGWLSYAIGTNDAEMAVWLADHSICPRKEDMERAMEVGNSRMVISFLPYIGPREIDFDLLWTGKATHHAIREISSCFTSKESIQSLLKSAAEYDAVWFLQESLERFTRTVLKWSIKYNHVEVYHNLSHQPPRKGKKSPAEIAFREMVDQGKDIQAMELIEHIRFSPNETILSAANSGGSQVVEWILRNHLLSETTKIQCVASGIAYDDIVPLLLTPERVRSDRDRVIVNSAAERGSRRTMQTVLQYLPPSCNPHTCEIVTARVNESISWLQNLLFRAIEFRNTSVLQPIVEYGKGGIESPAIMLAAANSRDVELIAEVARLGGDMTLAVRERAQRNDSATLIALFPHLSADLVCTAAQGITASWHADRVNSEIQRIKREEEQIRRRLSQISDFQLWPPGLLYIVFHFSCGFPWSLTKG